GGDWRWIELGFEGADTALHFVPRQNEEPSSDPVLVLVEDDVRRTVEALRAKGVEIVTEPEEAAYMPGVTVAEFRDSEGNRMVLSERLGVAAMADHRAAEHTAGDHRFEDPVEGDHSPDERSLRVPGARIHHEVRGS